MSAQQHTLDDIQNLYTARRQSLLLQMASDGLCFKACLEEILVNVSARLFIGSRLYRTPDTGRVIQGEILGELEDAKLAHC